MRMILLLCVTTVHRLKPNLKNSRPREKVRSDTPVIVKLVKSHQNCSEPCNIEIGQRSSTLLQKCKKFRKVITIQGLKKISFSWFLSNANMKAASQWRSTTGPHDRNGIKKKLQHSQQFFRRFMGCIVQKLTFKNSKKTQPECCHLVSGGVSVMPWTRSAWVGGRSVYHVRSQSFSALHLSRVNQHGCTPKSQN